jgi:hypothetical protein
MFQLPSSGLMTIRGLTAFIQIPQRAVNTLPPPKSLAIKVSIAVFVKTLEILQYSSQGISESPRHTVCSRSYNLASNYLFVFIYTFIFVFERKGQMKEGTRKWTKKRKYRFP